MGGANTLKAINHYQAQVKGVTYELRGAQAILNDDLEKLSFLDYEGNEVLVPTLYSDMLLDEGDTPQPFASYDELKAWVLKHLVLRGTILMAENAGVLSVDGYPYGKGTIEPVYDNVEEVAEGCISLISRSGLRIVSNEHYSRIFIENNTLPCDEYSDVLRWISDNLFVIPAEAAE